MHTEYFMSFLHKYVNKMYIYIIHIQLLLILYESPLFAMLHVLYHFDVVKNAQFFVKKIRQVSFLVCVQLMSSTDRNIMFCK